MTRGKDDDARAREDAFLGELIPQVTEHLAERHAGDFDAKAGQARFDTWLAAHTREPAVPAGSRLNEVEAELNRVIQENEELRAKLAEVLRGGKSAVPALSSPLSDPKPGMMAPERIEPERRQPEDNVDIAARVLSLAQQTADQAIADARREANETLDRARREADEMITKATRQVEQLTGDARAQAESLERDAQERHRQAMGSLVQTREELERRIDDLRAFEREYRSRLKAYLEGQLRDLEAGVTDTSTFPTMSSAPPQTPSPHETGAGVLDTYTYGPAPSGYTGPLPSPYEPRPPTPSAYGRLRPGYGEPLAAGPYNAPEAMEQRLPIFDSQESDWFRRSGKTLSTTQPAQAGQGSWTSPADEGWRPVAAAPAAGETTQAGLPMRVPRANLVPGSVGSGGQATSEAEAEPPIRSPDAARSRMASFQRRVREGRAAAPQIEEP